MRRTFTATGELDPDRGEPHADEVLLAKVQELRNSNPALSFAAAKQQVLRADPELAEQYKEQFQQ